MLSALRYCQNRILQSVSQDVREEILSRASYVETIHGQELYGAGAHIERVLFLESGMVVFTISMADGRCTMICTGDNRGTTVPYAGEGTRAINIACVVHIPGYAYAIEEKSLQKIALKHSHLDFLLRESGARNREEVAQLSVCNRLHSLKQRAARLLMAIYDSVGSKTFSLTQQEFSMMLGAHRPHIATIVAQFQRDGSIRYHHGVVQITDPGILEAVSCECYDALAHIHAARNVDEGAPARDVRRLSSIAGHNGLLRAHA